MTVPAIAAIEIPWEETAVDEADDPEVADVDAVGEGAAVVEDGD